MTQIEQAEARVARNVTSASGESLTCVLELRETGEALGECALFHANEQCRRAEIGFSLRRKYWRGGYMREAASAVIDHAFGTLRLNRLEADIDPRNVASAGCSNGWASRGKGCCANAGSSATKCRTARCMGCWRAIAADAAAAAADRARQERSRARCCNDARQSGSARVRPGGRPMRLYSQLREPALDLVFPAQRCNPSIGQRLFAVQHAGEAAGDGRGRIRVVAERDRALHAVLVAAVDSRQWIADQKLSTT